MIQIIKLSPVILLAGIVMSGTDVLIAAPLAVIYAAFVCMIVEKAKLGEVIDSAINSEQSLFLGMSAQFIMLGWRLPFTRYLSSQHFI